MDGEITFRQGKKKKKKSRSGNVSRKRGLDKMVASSSQP